VNLMPNMSETDKAEREYYRAYPEFSFSVATREAWRHGRLEGRDALRRGLGCRPTKATRAARLRDEREFDMDLR
jgi:hypothetical protein